jgi:hypothetical protein
MTSYIIVYGYDDADTKFVGIFETKKDAIEFIKHFKYYNSKLRGFDNGYDYDYIYIKELPSKIDMAKMKKERDLERAGCTNDDKI